MAASGWTCACGAKNLPRQRACEFCGEAKPTATTPTHRESPRCEWVSPAGLRCRMLASIGTACSWHDIVFALGMARHADEYAEFERWVARQRGLGVCSDWTHAPGAWLWELVSGRDVPPGEPSRSGCGRGWPACPWAEADERPAMAGLERMAAQRAADRPASLDRTGGLIAELRAVRALVHVGRSADAIAP